MTVLALKKDDDSWCYDQSELQNLVVKYYTDLYTDPNPYIVLPLPALCDSWVLSQEDRETLMMDLTLDELRPAS